MQRKIGQILSCIGIFLWFIQWTSLSAQTVRTGQIQGIVLDKKSQEPLIGVTIQIAGLNLGAQTDIDGRYKINNIPTGSYNLTASYVGYAPFVQYNIVVTSGNANQVNFQLQEESTLLDEVKVVVNRSVSVASTESPNSIQKLSVEEIKNNPGGNFDISRVLSVLPGVGGTAGSVGGFRNDLIIRGGGPNENVFYLDGIEIPVINHFATQGSSGGPTGILNVSFIEDATLSSSSFNARYDNALSSVLQFKQREGNSERVQGNIRLSATELATTLEGPLGKNTTFLGSVRRSYLQLLFSAIDLPIRPNYWDFQYKVTHKINKKTTLTAIGVGAIDDFSFGVPKESSPEKEYILRSNPLINQWNYTVGVSLKRLLNNGFMDISLSRNMFDNRLDRFEDGVQEESRRVLGSNSQEIENKLRINVQKYLGPWEYSYGFVAQYVKYNNDFLSILSRDRELPNGVIIPGITLRFDTDIQFFKYGAYGQIARKFLDDRLSLSAGLRTDMNSFTTTGNNPIETLSPRLSASYQVAPKWRINASAGRYFKTPIYTVLGYQAPDVAAGGDAFVNRDNNYLQSDHLVSGLEFIPRPQTRVTVEGFYKKYNDYPVSALTGISLANQGGDFGAIGNEKTVSVGEGQSYGLEFFFQQKLAKNIFGVVSYTWFNSQFSGIDGVLKPSSWDSRHLISAQLGRKFKRGWEMGLKWLYQGGAPYTPFDLAASQQNYFLLGVGTLDFNRLNTERLPAFRRFDFRLDKKWNYNKWTLDVFIDVQNAFVQSNPALPQYTFARNADNSGFATTDGLPLASNGANAIPLILSNNDPQVTPTIGFVVEF